MENGTVKDDVKNNSPNHTNKIGDKTENSEYVLTYINGFKQRMTKEQLKIIISQKNLIIC